MDIKKIYGYAKMHLLLFTLFGEGVTAEAQTDVNYSQLIYNPGLINPSSQGRSMDITADLLAARQWNGVPGAPRSLGFNLHGGLKRFGIAAGLVGHFEKYVISRRSLTALNLSAGIHLTPVSTLTFGIRFGVDWTTYNRDNIIGAPGDQFLGQSQHCYATGAGITFQYKGLLAGASALVNMNENNAFYVNLQYDIPLSRQWNIKPVAMYKYHTDWQEYAEFGCVAGVPKWFQAGATYRTSGSIILLGQLNLFERLSLRYSYHFYTDDVQQLSTDSSEIGVSFNFSNTLRTRRMKVWL